MALAQSITTSISAQPAFEIESEFAVSWEEDEEVNALRTSGNPTISSASTINHPESGKRLVYQPTPLAIHQGGRIG